ncbi:MAG: hypothetical protein JWO38_5007 [Gemmataceae bacterium]|nr:hypothetical protein [Gemmataceae bacterium]
MAVEPVVIVVKVGGSLYGHPGLGPGLRAFLDSLAPAPVLLVPGGGPFADAVRTLDAAHQLGEESAHWLALNAMRTAGAFLGDLLWREPQAGQPLPENRITIQDCLAFAVDDEKRPDHLPHSWAVTSDSIAARLAIAEQACRLILLKSVDIPPGTPWAEAANRGWVDRHFPAVVAGQNLRVEAVHFRRRLDGHGSAAR